MNQTQENTDVSKTDEYRWNLLQKKAQEVRVCRAFAFFRTHDIEPILIKGWAAGRYYPKDKFRLSIDIDLAVSAADFDKAARLNRTPEAAALAIDLHRELRHLDTLAWDTLFENSETIDTEHGGIRVLAPEDHLRVMVVHWLTDGGADRSRLWDITYAVENRPGGFDWDRCLGVVRPNRRRWVVCTIGLAHLHDALRIDDLPFAEECTDLPGWMIKTVEREWSGKDALKPLEHSLYDLRSLAAQVKRRLKPNALYATVSMEGDLDSRFRFFYQIGNFFQRALPSIRRVSRSLKNR